MAKSQLEKAISEAANDFALQIIEAVKASTLEELLALQGAEAPKRRGRPPKSATEEEAPPRSGEKTRPSGQKSQSCQEGRQRKKRNYPKCAYPECKKNKFARGKGFCGEHAKMFEAGEIESAEYYAENAE